MTRRAAHRAWRARVQPWIEVVGEALVLFVGCTPALPDDRSQSAGICACARCVRELMREIQQTPRRR
jgi:hypothetical protein